MSETVRAFVAIRPSEEVLHTLSSPRAELEASEWGPAFRWIPLENLHLTLLFLGNIEPSSTEALTAALQAATTGVEPFQLELSGLGCFPNARRPSVLWVGMRGELERLHALQAAVVTHCARFGSHRETKPYRAHLTLARAKTFDTRLGARLSADIERLSHRTFGSWECASVRLMASKLNSQVPEYSELAGVTLSEQKTL